MWKLTRWILVASIFWIGGYFYNTNSDPEVQWIQSIYEDKIEKTHKINTPQRILIIGGSGTHFGIDSTLIEQQLNIPVLNLGLHAGLGLNTILSSTQETIKAGDLVILIPEYGLLASKDGTGNFSSTFGATINKPGIGGNNPEHKAREILLMGIPGSDRTVQGFKKLLSQLTSPSQTPVQNSEQNDSGYNDNLDQRGNPKILPQGEPLPYPISEQVSPYSLQRLQTFKKTVEAAEATLVLELPWVFSDQQSQETVKKIVEVLTKAELTPIFYNDDLNLKQDPLLFGDTVYHLSIEGRKLRSLELAQQIQDKLY